MKTNKFGLGGGGAHITDAHLDLTMNSSNFFAHFKNERLPVFSALWLFCFILAAENSIFYRVSTAPGETSSVDLPVNAKYGYITFTTIAGVILYFDLNNERYHLQIFL